MWKFLRAFASGGAVRRQSCRPEPGPFATFARDYAALDATAWAIARRRVHVAETEAR